MKRVFSYLSVVLGVGFIVSFAMLQSGCEEASGLEGLKIDPASATIATNGQTVVFTVVGGVTNRDLALPLQWRVSDERIGRIISSSGFSAIYQRTGGSSQVNTITAIDQYDNEGYATVRHESAGYAIVLSAEPASIKVGEASTITITSDGSLVPYTWRKRSGPGTLTGSAGSKSAVYTSDTAGSAVIEVTDANGASGIIGIVVESAGGTGGGEGGS